MNIHFSLDLSTLGFVLTGEFALVETIGEAFLCLDFLLAGRQVVGLLEVVPEDEGDLVGVLVCFLFLSLLVVTLGMGGGVFSELTGALSACGDTLD